MELRDVRDGWAMMWRDFTEAERTRMGEIDDIRYALVRTMQLAVQDVETGKCLSGWRTTTARSLRSCRTARSSDGVDDQPLSQQLEWQACRNPARSKDDSKFCQCVCRKGQWVQGTRAPDIKNTETRRKVRARPVWNDIQEHR